MDIVHGGDIYRNKIDLDFSVSLNPMGCPVEISDAIKRATERISEYPDPAQDKVRSELSGAFGVRSENVIAGAGASEIFAAIVESKRPGKALLTAPSFYGYEYALKATGECEIKRHILKEEDEFRLTEDYLNDLTEDIDIAFLCSPNNPTGRVIEKELLLKIVKTCRDKNTLLVLDECFLELSDSGESMAGLVDEYNNLIIVKAFTKLFSMPGVRLGFAISCRDNTHMIRRHLPEWNLSVFAEEVAVAGCGIIAEGKDSGFIHETGNLIKTERAYLIEKLSELGLKVFSSDTNFLLIRSDNDLYSALSEKGILIRDCSNFEGLRKGFYRIAVKDHKSNEILIASLKKLL